MRVYIPNYLPFHTHSQDSYYMYVKVSKYVILYFNEKGQSHFLNTYHNYI